MVQRKKVLEELQKFNQDLEKHLPELNLDYLKNKDIFSKKENYLDIVPLLANNLMDLKTEIALIRRNLVDSVEGMVLRVVSEQQQAFAGQMDRMFTQMLVEMKGNFSSYVSEISAGMSTIKKDLNELKIENSKLQSKFEAFDSKMIELKSVIEDIKTIKSDIPFLIEQNIDEVKNINSNLLNSVENELEKQSSKFETLKFEIDEIKTKEDRIRTDLINNFSKKFLEVSNRNIELENSLNKIVSKVTDINDNFKQSTQTKIIDKIKEIPIIVQNNNNLKENSQRKLKKLDLDSNNISKLISIEERIRKLDSLK